MPHHHDNAGVPASSDRKPAAKTRSRIARYALPLVACALLAGCAAAVPLLSSAGSAALQMAGIGKPDAQKPPRNLDVTLFAAQNLNAANDHRPLALVVRLYVLKDPTSFQQAPFDTFTDPTKEKATLGGDLLSVREVTLIPGQRYNAIEKVVREAQAFGVVALFRDPAQQRWKVTFDPSKSEKSGIIIGLHNCAMTVTDGTVIPSQQGLPTQQWNLLSSATCG